jgi:ATP-dependent Clp protease ATP-binding subunit ClpB
MLEGEREKLLKMEEVIGARVIGQKDAVTAVSKAVRRARAGLQDPNRPWARSSSSAPRASARPS